MNPAVLSARANLVAVGFDFCEIPGKPDFICNDFGLESVGSGNLSGNIKRGVAIAPPCYCSVWVCHCLSLCCCVVAAVWVY